KILLVNPPIWHKLDANPYKCPPITLMYLLNYIKKFNYSGKILDLAFIQNYKDYYSKYLRQNKFQIIGFTGITLQRFDVLDLIKITAIIQPEAMIFVGGPHFTATAKETIESIPEIDVIVHGEGEISLLKLMKRYENNKGLDGIEGISYRENGKIFHNPNQTFVAEIEQFSINDSIYENIIMPDGEHEHLAKFANYESDNKKGIIVTAGRGCPGKCIFCLNFRKFKPRYKRLDAIINEIIEKKKKYKCNNFMFWDPCFIKRRIFFEEFCKKLIKEKIVINWWAETRPDFDVSLLKLAKESGCISLDIGMESASQKVLDVLKKNIKIEQVQDVVDKCYELGIKVHVTAMVSMPDETTEDILKTLKFLSDNSYKLSNISISPTQILPGTELEEIAKKRGVIHKDFTWYDRDAHEINQKPDIFSINVPIWTEYFSRESILSIIDRINIIEKGLSWDNFIKITGIKSDAKIVVYSAGGATLNFLSRLSKDYPKFHIEFIIDKYKNGELNGIPILDMNTALKKQFDFIIVTTFGHYDEVKDLLIGHDFKEYEDFAFLYFYEDMIEQYIRLQIKPKMNCKKALTI
ncbi:B12-binding domain-containing radical SAM protein, partial [bacterium]|nr:B12-binding domain-containing radical SAM protein [bacterium]